jgi:hypothetical protein
MVDGIAIRSAGQRAGQHSIKRDNVADVHGAESDTIGLTGVAFTDTLPAGLVVAATPNMTNNCGGTATAVAGSSSVSLSAGTVAAGGADLPNCYVGQPRGFQTAAAREGWRLFLF